MGGRQRGRETPMCERTMDQVAPHLPPIGDMARNPGLCPDRELNWQPFSSQADDVQSIEPHQPRPAFSFIVTYSSVKRTRPNIEGNRELQNVAPLCISLILRVFRTGEHIINDSPLGCGKNPPFSHGGGGSVTHKSSVHVISP